MMILSNILIDGFAQGMVLFMISAGLSVTMGLTRVVNLAQGGFAVLGGYFVTFLLGRAGLPFELAFVVAVAGVVVICLPIERVLFRRLYDRSELEQALITIGLLFILIASVNFVFGASVRPVEFPAYASGTLDLGFRYVPKNRLLVIGAGLLVCLGLWYLIERTSFGLRVRATVDHGDAAASLGINTRAVYGQVFLIGVGVAAIGGILGADLLPVEPFYGLKYLVLILAVVAVGGYGSVLGSLMAALLLGFVETAGKYLIPDAASILFFVTMIVVLLVRPQGLAGRAVQ